MEEHLRLELCGAKSPQLHGREYDEEAMGARDSSNQSATGPENRVLVRATWKSKILASSSTLLLTGSEFENP